MLTWWGIMLDVVDTPYRGGVLCLRGGALWCGVSTTVVRIGSLACSQSPMVPQNLRTQNIELVAVTQTLPGAFFSFFAPPL